NNPPIPDPDSGRDDAKAAETPLRIAIRSDLTARLATLLDRANDALGQIAGTDANDPVAVAATLDALKTWRFAAGATLESARSDLQSRVDASAAPPIEINAL